MSYEHTIHIATLLHYKVTQTMPEGHGTINWFDDLRKAEQFANRLAGEVVITGHTCEQYESMWPQSMRHPHFHRPMLARIP